MMLCALMMNLLPISAQAAEANNWYEVFVRSYQDSDGDGLGDLQGLISRLDYIADMGYNGLWLMPVMSSPSYHKYDVTNYMEIDHEYGYRSADTCKFQHPYHRIFSVGLF